MRAELLFAEEEELRVEELRVEALVTPTQWIEDGSDVAAVTHLLQSARA